MNTTDHFSLTVRSDAQQCSAPSPIAAISALHLFRSVIVFFLF